MYGGAWCVPGAVSVCCTCHMCLLYVWSGMLGAHLVQEGSGMCKIPISYGVMGLVCILRDMYA